MLTHKNTYKHERKISREFSSLRKKVNSITSGVTGNKTIIQSSNSTVTQRGVAVFVSETEPTNPEINDIWIQII